LSVGCCGFCFVVSCFEVGGLAVFVWAELFFGWVGGVGWVGFGVWGFGC